MGKRFRQASDEEWEKNEKEKPKGEHIACIVIDFYERDISNFISYLDDGDKRKIAKRLIDLCQAIVDNPEMAYHVVRFCEELQKN